MPLKPGEYEKLLSEPWEVQPKGLFRRLFKLYWKRASIVLLMLILPGGLAILCICAVAWALNWAHEMDAYFEQTYKKWKEERGIHS
jgi:hypothetical protein